MVFKKRKAHLSMGGNWKGLFLSLCFLFFFIQNIVYVNTQLNTGISVLKQTIFDREMIIKKKNLLLG